MSSTFEQFLQDLPEHERNQFASLDLDPTLQALIRSERPDLYLINIGLTEDQYRKTKDIPAAVKDFLAEQIIKKAKDDEILKIIKSLVELEFHVESSNPIRSGNRLIGLLMRNYIAKQEWIPREGGREFSVKEAKTSNHIREQYEEAEEPKLNLTSYTIAGNVKKMWLIMQQAAMDILGERYEVFSNQGLISTPGFHYEQLLPQPTDEAIISNKEKPIALTPLTKEGFDALVEGVETPEFSDDVPIAKHLENIKNHIRATEWKVGDYFFFKGGVDNGQQCVPHRINEILNVIDAFESREIDASEREIFAKAAYDEIVKFAQQANDEPRRGQNPSTKAFYLDIINHRVLGDDYEFAIKPEPNGSAISSSGS
jgi:hypothetical protein